MAKKIKDANIGRKFRTRYEHSEVVTVIKLAKVRDLEGWYLVKYEIDGKRCCMHRDMLALAN